MHLLHAVQSSVHCHRLSRKLFIVLPKLTKIKKTSKILQNAFNLYEISSSVFRTFSLNWRKNGDHLNIFHFIENTCGLQFNCHQKPLYPYLMGVAGLFLVEKPQRRAERGGKSQSRVGEALPAQVKADRRAPYPYIRLPGARGKL